MRDSVDDNAKHTVRKIFEDLRRHQPMMRTRKSDRVNTDQMLQELREPGSKRK